MLQINENFSRVRRAGQLLLALCSLAILAASVGCGSHVSCGVNETVVDGKCQTIRCDKDKKACPTGTYCAENGACTIHPDVTCSKDSDCGNGMCVANKCVNPKWCHANRECMPGDSCDQDSNLCVVSVCPDGCRDGGVCDVASKKCVNKDTCSSSTETEDCIKGEKCVDDPNNSGQKVCMNGADFCNTVPCQRGVCDPTTYSCKSASDCYLDDKNCLAGEYCDQHQCKKSACADDKSGCTDGRGKCNPTNGQCENKPDCTSDKECLSGYKCVYSLPASVAKRTGQCVLENTQGDYCKPDCPGDQVCTDKGDDQYVCEEPATCSSALDCKGERVCTWNKTKDAHVCGGPFFCGAPHHGDMSTPEVIAQDLSHVTLCSGVDYYTYTPTGIQADQDVLVEFSIDPTDVGIGDVTVSITSSDKSEAVLEKKLSALGTDGNILSFTLHPNASAIPTYTIKVESAAGTTQAIHYSLNAKVLSKVVSGICKAAKKAELNKPNDGVITAQSSVAMKDCSDDAGIVREEVWYFDLPKGQTVSATVLGVPGFNPGISIRKACDDSKDSLACENVQPVDKSESVRSYLEAGRYYIVVQEEGKKDYNYTLRVDTADPVCSQGEMSCTSDEMKYCSIQRDSVKTFKCQAGCDSGKGYCNDLKGLICMTARHVDANTPFDGKDLPFVEDSSNINLKSDCGSVTSARTKNSEQIFAVDVPAGYTIRASVKNAATTFRKYTKYSLYLLDSCLGGTSPTCLDGVSGTDSGASFLEQNLVWTNHGADQTLYLVVDSGPSASPWGGYEFNDNVMKADVHVDVSKLLCDPNTFSCDGDTLKQCSLKGDAWSDVKTCSAGTCATSASAKQGYCQLPDGNKGDECSNPIELTTAGTSAGPYNSTLGALNYPAASSSTCPGHKSSDLTSDFNDHVFKVHANHIGDKVTFTVTPDSDTIAGVWVTKECSTDMGDKCLNGKVAKTKGDAVSVDMIAENDNEDFYFVVQAKSLTGTTDGTYSVQYAIESRDSRCFDTSGQLLEKVFPCASGKITYCDAIGHLSEYSCGTDVCSDGASSCPTPRGGICSDAIPVDLSSADKGTIQGTLPTNDSPHYKHNPGLHVGDCFFNPSSSYEGSEVIYKVSIPPHKRFSADFLVQGVLDSKQYGMKFYLLKECQDQPSDMDSCEGSFFDGNQVIDYVTGDQDEDIYLVVDFGKKNESLPASQKFNIHWTLSDDTIRPKIANCQPGSFTCDGDKLSYCENGQARSLSCDAGKCHEGACEIETTDTVGSSCSKSSVITLQDSELDQGRHLRFKWNTENLVQAPKNKCSSAEGEVRYFKVSLTKGTTLYVDAFSIGGDPVSVFLQDSCTGGYESCAFSEEGTNSLYGNVRFKYVAEKNGDYYISVLPTSKGNVDIVASIWKVGACNSVPPTCDSEHGKSIVSYCNDGITRKLYCENGCEKASTGGHSQPLCLSGSGDACFDAKILSGLSGDLANETLLDHGTHQGRTPYYFLRNAKFGVGNWDRSSVTGGCLFDREPGAKGTVKKDMFYAISLNKGDSLHATLDNFKNGYLAFYLLGDCVEQKCLLNDFQVGTIAKRQIDFVAPETKTYYLVVLDMIGNSLVPGYSLHWKVTPHGSSEQGTLDEHSTSCTPFSSQCFDDGHGKIMLHACLKDGKSVQVSECPAGTRCDSGACVVEDYNNSSTGSNYGINSCVDNRLVEVKSSSRFDIRYSKIVPEISRKLACDRMPIDTPEDQSVEGGDAFFKVTIPKGKSLRIWAKSVVKGDSIAYQTAADCSTLASKCDIGGIHTFEKAGVYEEIAFFPGSHLGSDKTFTIALSGVSNETFYARSYYFNFFTPECSEIGQKLCDTSHSDVLKYCVEGDFYESYTCSSHTCDASTNSCSSPTGDVCEEAIPLTVVKGSEQTKTGNFANHTDSLNLSKKAASCTLQETQGRDVIYSIKLAKGETLDATVEGSGTYASQDLAIYLLTSCSPEYIVRQCLTASDKLGFDRAQPDNPQPESIHYVAPNDQTVYLVVDSYWLYLNSNYTLKWTVK